MSQVLVDTGTVIPVSSIATQCYEDYFYGIDGTLEKAFGITEGQFSSALGDLSAEHLEKISPDDLHQIRLFVHYQRMRTLAAAEALNDSTDAFLKKILAHVDLPPAPEGFGLDSLRIELEKPQLMNVYQAAATQPLLLDLEVKFLFASRGAGFVVSDHPVVASNQWAEHHPRFGDYDGTSGLALRGLQWFLPLTPTTCIAVFDPEVYRYGSPKRRVCTIGSRDVRLLNTLQGANAYQSIFFDPRITPRDEVQRILRERSSLLAFRKAVVSEGDLLRPDGTIGQLIQMTSREVKVRRRLNCIEVVRFDDYDGYRSVVLPVRSAELVELMHSWSKELDEISKAAVVKQGIA